MFPRQLHGACRLAPRAIGSLGRAQRTVQTLTIRQIKHEQKHCRGDGNEAEIPSFAQCKVPLPNYVLIFFVLLPVSNTTHRHLSFKNQGHRHTQQKTWQNRRTSWQPAKFRRHQPSVIKKIIQMQCKMPSFSRQCGC